MNSSKVLIEVALPIPFRHTFTYEVPGTLYDRILFGSRVVVPFRKRSLIGVVTAVGAKQPQGPEFQIKSVQEVLEGGSVLSSSLYDLCRWVSDYYFAPIGEVLRAACPLAFTSSTRSFVELTTRGRKRLAESKGSATSGDLFDGTSEDSEEIQILHELSIKPKTDWRLLRKKFNSPRGEELFARLKLAGDIRIHSETTKHAVTEKHETVVRISPGGPTMDIPQRLTPGQRRVIEFLVKQGGVVRLKELISSSKVSSATIQTLAKRMLVQLEQVRRDRVPIELSSANVPETELPSSVALELTVDQKRALRIIQEAIDRPRFSALLLHGVTASGKTEVYLRAMERVLAGGGTALMMVPEIALTPAAARTFAMRFSHRVAILHSGLSEGERYDEWWRIKNGEARVVIGTRSGVFAPLENLRLVVVDEEHDGSYKQQESPRYHGRDVAILRAKMSEAVVVLGSATPSLESFQNAQRGKYQLIALKNRVESRALAQVKVVDMRKEFAETKKNNLLSREMVSAIQSRLEANEQVLILLNRRGFSSFVLCRSCGASRQCPNCSITMTYHKRRHLLICHYCATAARVPEVCWQCHSEHLYFVGAGTEQIEEKLREFFPLARIARLDRDAVQSRGGAHRILGEFREGTTDLLVGTQMIAKGHDFPRVTLVGVLNADGALGFPDFRAAERTFQLLTQVAGRSGRGLTPGEVVLQAFYPEHYAIRFAAKQSFIDFYNKEIHFRRMMHYPPFAQLALVGIRHENFDEAMKLAKALGAHLRTDPIPEVRVLGPAMAPLARVKKEYRWQLLLKVGRRSALKQVIERCLRLCEEKKIAEPNVIVDVDPTNMM